MGSQSHNYTIMTDEAEILGPSRSMQELLVLISIVFVSEFILTLWRTYSCSHKKQGVITETHDSLIRLYLNLH